MSNSTLQIIVKQENKLMGELIYVFYISNVDVSVLCQVSVSGFALHRSQLYHESYKLYNLISKTLNHSRLQQQLTI
jgi:hypothetical protein